jgi:hypothetical protein
MSTRVAALFVSALLGVLVVGGVAVCALGLPVLAGYLVVVAVGLGLLLRRARSLARHRAGAGADPDAGSGRTCACCTSTVFDPVEIR